MRNKGKRLGALALVVLLGACAFPSTVWAGDPVEKLGRGLSGVLTGWIEIPNRFSRGLHEENPFAGAALGLWKGTGMALLRMGVGVYETATFVIPYPSRFESAAVALGLAENAWE